MEGKEHFDERQRQRLTYCLYLVGFLDLFGVSLLIPLISHHARELGASPTTVGMIMSIYGTLQLISGPFVGRWSDVSGRRFVLLFCLLMTGVGYFLKSIATTVLFLILSRIPLGLFKHGMEANKALFAETTPKEDRPRVFGQYNACSSTGFILGPLIGGYLSEVEGGFYTVARITSLLFFLNFVIVFFFIHPPIAKTLSRTESVRAFTTDEFSLNIKDFFKSFRLIFDTCFDIFIVRFLMAFAIIIYRSNFSLMLQQEFDITPKTIGQLISFGSMVSTAAGMFTGRIVKFYSNETRLLLHSSIAQVLTLIGLTFAANLPMFVFCITCLSVENSVSRVCITDMSVKRSNRDNTGALLGLSASLMSTARAIAPFIAGLSQEISYKGPGIIGITSGVIGCVCIVTILKSSDSDTHKKDDTQKKDD
ncbi:major facilitator superfamily domain-containing protein 9-like [Amphiura filiformis]|uniref:major facilitator superfamily domain-containing protein 9-like n=1 Tax=Amphiura filiformis TaxID=82378 RepID=UPI003B21AD89